MLPAVVLSAAKRAEMDPHLISAHAAEAVNSTRLFAPRAASQQRFLLSHARIAPSIAAIASRSSVLRARPGPAATVAAVAAAVAAAMVAAAMVVVAMACHELERASKES